MKKKQQSLLIKVLDTIKSLIDVVIGHSELKLQKVPVKIKSKHSSKSKRNHNDDTH